MLTPRDFGLPSRFTDWRPDQLTAITQIVDSPARFVALCAPTGFGKSLVYEAAAHMSGMRTCILTSTKGLQDQLSRDFGEINADIRGQTNYRCPIATTLNLPVYTCVADAPCRGGMPCDLRGDGRCEYYEKYRVAQRSPIVVTNYSCWFYDAVRQDRLDAQSPFDMLVLDEAHDAPEQLAGYLQVEIERKDVVKLGIDWPNAEKFTFDDWKQWGRRWAQISDEKYKDGGQGYAERALWKKLGRKFGRIAGMSGESSWVIEPKVTDRSPKSNPLSVRFDPLWVQPYAERVLFRGIKKIVLVSATVRPKTAELLGIIPPSASSLGMSTAQATVARGLDFREYASNFPVVSRPTIHVPTVQMNYRNEQDDYKLGMWLAQIDRILEGRPDRKGIIHAVSYKRARLIYENSRHSSRMLIHGSEDARAQIQKFKTSSEPCVLISPSVTTGYDFPYQECEFQIIGKIPFPPTTDAVIKARTKQDKDYGNYIAMQTLVQMVGRGCRAKDDRCETLIIDDNIYWFLKQNRKFAPKWFLDACYESEYVPKPLPKL